ncbi:MAG: helix-turn-helix domain-containing protein, partial [Candidatus Omnitrophica bacterium]|nr:helix-turn-helix domain-containing protein [Candidatus Omnitrophota bacterium]
MPESLGKTLKKIRKSKGFSLEEASEKTRIPKNTLSIIEEDRLNEIESLFYARGFVKSYAQFLGAMEDNVVKRYLSGAPKKD